MKTSINKTIIIARIALIVITFGFASCSTDTNPAPANNIIERTDMQITGSMNVSEFVQSEQGDASNDIISFNFYGSPSDRIDYIIRMSNGNSLIITSYDAERMNPWEQVGQPYNIYPASDLEDKLSYVNVELRTAAGEPIFATHINEATPPGISLDVFKITRFDGETIQARMRDMTLYSVNEDNTTITINGTFIGAVTFE